MKKKYVWISWERQRRSLELASAFGCLPLILDKKVKYRLIRYSYCTYHTFIFLLKNKPTHVFCQNPSIVLAFVLCLIKVPFCYKLIVDRHTNFMFSKTNNYTKKIFMFLSKFTIKYSDITIVTNKPLLNDYIEPFSSNGFILQDKLPCVSCDYNMKFSDKKKNILFITSFGSDEPIEEYLEAIDTCDSDIHTYITGNYKKYHKELKNTHNVTFTGFVDDSFYLTLLNAVDIVIVLTKHDYTLTCGAYESVSAGKPMVLSNTNVLREYFNSGAVYADNTAQSIRESIEYCFKDFSKLSHEVIVLRSALKTEWNATFEELRGKISALK